MKQPRRKKNGTNEKGEYVSDYLAYRQQTFWDRVQEEYDLRIALFGKDQADEWSRRNRPLHLVQEQLWREKGFKTRGEYDDWEENHKEERNAYLKAKGVYDLWVNG